MHHHHDNDDDNDDDDEEGRREGPLMWLTRFDVVVEDVEINRQPLSKLEAIYFLSPTATSVDALIRDFDPAVKKKRMYAQVHVFFTSSTSFAAT